MTHISIGALSLRNMVTKGFITGLPMTSGAYKGFTQVPFKHTYSMFLSCYWGEPYWTMKP